ncbi:nicotinate-nucleotide pyrophosphorylase [Peptostreptococcus russellii]|uniref:Probable nicotinate-nucleotide pyrophosphorylase [carboxylating] n=1 Tax=Peptostreptococcus russellii TaxID=215200 RepID=A0A2P7Q317_9FIRM|nr:nicotinate-nucleotide pyrophosphorylase [Peptostreptococcus russellii]
MNLPKLNNFQIDDVIKSALREDITSWDLSTNAIYEDNKLAKISLISKDNGVVSGLDVFKRTFKILDDEIFFVDYKKEGDEVSHGDLILEIIGKASSMLSGERVALNFLQRMSGIASLTKNMIDALDDPNIAIVDTRKTTPNLRIFEKYSVRVGGGNNHRYNLSDGIMLKDNHIDAAGSIKRAVELVRKAEPFIKKIEVEVENLDMLREALDSNVDIIMLDNMDIDTIKEAINIVDGQALIECSGNIEIDNISRFRNLKIDFISSGSLTHSAKSLDFSLKNLRYIDEWNSI